LISGVIDRVRRDNSSEPLKDWVLDRLLPRLTQRSIERVGLRASDSSALRLVGWALGGQAKALLADLLVPTLSPTTQRVAIESLASDDRKFNEFLLRKIPELTPAVQQTAWEMLGRKRSGLLVIAFAVDNGELDPADIPLAVRETIKLSRDARVQSAIPVTLFSPAAMPDSVGKYFAAIERQGDPDVGEPVFRKHCASCHAPEPGGNLVGPALKSVVKKNAEQILVSILDPNREVDPKYYRVQVLTTNGSIVVGVLSEETDSTLAIVDAQGKRHSLLRKEIESLQSVKQSLMPSGLEKEISPEQMRDLISFLKSSL
ncbi:MAG: hypothetical protein AAFU85_31410, partial [Planctomycetota bacterium]